LIVSRSERERERVTYEQEVVILGFCPQVLEDALFPVPLHLVPIFDLTMLDRVVQVVRLGVREGFVSDVEIEVVDPTFRR
jgi:hypothetical protein